MRQSPEEKSSNYEVGKRKRGLDGNMWEVTVDSRGIKRWTKVTKGQKARKISVRRRSSIKNKYTVFDIKKFKPMLAQTYDKSVDPSGYWASEKLDGIRSIFTGEQFISRTNKTFSAPDWFIKEMPKGVILDGELYTKRDDFQNVMSIVSKNVPIDTEWRNIQYMVFDLPTMKVPFEERMQELEKIVTNTNSKYLKYVPQVKIENSQQLELYEKEITSKGGEGIMLRRPNSSYENKRSNFLLKMKTFKDDEAIVVGYQKGTGKYKSVMGKLDVKWLKGDYKDIVFSVGSGFNDYQREEYKTLFPIGTIIKVKFFEISPKTGKPRFPVFLGVRSEKDVV